MRHRLWVWVAVGVATAASGAVVATQVVAYVLRVGMRGGLPQTLVTTAFVTLLVGTFLVVGGVVAARRPHHPVGWLLLAIGVAGAALSTGGVIHGLAGDPWVRSFGAWLDAGLWHPSFPALGLLLLLFPTGQPPTPRWRWLQRALVTLWLVLVLTAPFTTPGMLLEFYPDAAPLVAGPWSDPLVLPHDIAQGAVFPLLLASVVAMVLRAARSRGLERQQLKWFAGSVLLIAVMFPVSLVVAGDGSIGALFFVLLPISCAVAVLRYRLYEIDRLISRTVTYALVVALLVAAYAGGVLLVGSVFPLQGELAVAASTLAVAALFNPLRRRVQFRVDRRFNRSRYDAGQEVARFVRRLRGELDLDTLGAELTQIADRTIAPAGVSLWLRQVHDVPYRQHPDGL